MAYEPITTDPDVMGGLPRLRILRIRVATVIAMLADGMSAEEIVAELPDLTQDDIHEARLYAAETVRERSYHCGIRREIFHRREPLADPRRPTAHSGTPLTLV
jgi:uncharacterized protein (DUF433 family)